MKECYLTGDLLTDENKSLEHIIPNALGGKIKSKNILSKNANTKLLKNIDDNFNKIFEIFYRRLSLKKDRNVKTGLIGIIKEYNKEVISKDNKCFPRKPLYDPEKKIIYAQSIKIGNGFLKKYKSENKINKEENVKVLTDMSGTIEFKFSLDNDIFPNGLAKIACGYASLCGINRSDLIDVIDFEKNKFKDRLIVIPYYPASKQEMLFEKQFLNSIHTPIHSLVLKGSSIDRILYCHVELFSVFQYTIILNTEYSGTDIYESYFFDLLESKEISYPEYINSIFNDIVMKSILPKYRSFNRRNIDFMVDVVKNKKTLLKSYTFDKFESIEKLIAYQELQKKMEILDKKFSSQQSTVIKNK